MHRLFKDLGVDDIHASNQAMHNADSLSLAWAIIAATLAADDPRLQVLAESIRAGSLRPTASAAGLAITDVAINALHADPVAVTDYVAERLMTTALGRLILTRAQQDDPTVGPIETQRRAKEELLNAVGTLAKYIHKHRQGR